MKKWQLLLFILTICIISFLVVIYLSVMFTPLSVTTYTTVFVPASINVTCYDNLDSLGNFQDHFYTDVRPLAQNQLFGRVSTSEPTYPVAEGNYSLSCGNSTVSTIVKWFESWNLDAEHGANYSSGITKVLGFWIQTRHDTNTYASSLIEMRDKDTGQEAGMRFDYSDADHTTVSGVLDAWVSPPLYTLTAGNWYWCETVWTYYGANYVVNGTSYGGHTVAYDTGSNCTIKMARTTGTVQAAYYDFVRVANDLEFPPTYDHYETTSTTTITNDIIGEDEILMVIGLIGAMFVVVAPVYTVETFIEGDHIEAFGFGFLAMLLGVAFIIAWLW
jgi:hypothetical protein